jgi:hypothetical protein
MSEIGFDRNLAGFRARLSVGQGVQGNTTNGRQDKSTDLGRAHVVGSAGFFGHFRQRAAGAFGYFASNFNAPSAIPAAVSAGAP